MQKRAPAWWRCWLIWGMFDYTWILIPDPTFRNWSCVQKKARNYLWIMPPLMYRQTTNNSLELRRDLQKKLWSKSNTFLRQFSFYKSKNFFHLFSWFCLTDFWIFIPRKWIINRISNPCWASPWKFQFHPISEKSGFGQSAWWILNIVRQYTGRNF